MTAFLPSHINYNLHYEENEINNLVKDQDEPYFAEYDVYISRLYIYSYIIASGVFTIILWLKC